MKEAFEINKLIMDAIEKAMIDYAYTLQNELTEKYTAEFTERMCDHRRKIVLDVCEHIEIGNFYDVKSMEPQVTIRLERSRHE